MKGLDVDPRFNNEKDIPFVEVLVSEALIVYDKLSHYVIFRLQGSCIYLFMAWILQDNYCEIVSRLQFTVADNLRLEDTVVTI